MAMDLYASEAERLEVGRILRSFVNLKEIVLKFRSAAETKTLLTKNALTKKELGPLAKNFRHFVACGNHAEGSGCCVGTENYVYLFQDLDSFEQALKEATSDAFLEASQDQILATASEKYQNLLQKTDKRPSNDQEKKYLMGQFLEKTVDWFVSQRLNQLLTAEETKYNSLPLLVADPKTNHQYFGDRVTPDMFQKFQTSGLLKIDSLLDPATLEQLRTELDYMEKLNLFERGAVEGQPVHYLDYIHNKIPVKTKAKFPCFVKVGENLTGLPHFLNRARFAGLRVVWQVRFFNTQQFLWRNLPEIATKNQLWGKFFIIFPSKKFTDRPQVADLQPTNELLFAGDALLATTKSAWVLSTMLKGPDHRYFVVEVSLNSAEV